MKLSTLLLLLEGKSYFPSVTRLREGDPLEAALGDEFDEMLWQNLVNSGEARQVFEFISEKRKAEWPEEFPESDWGPIHSGVLGELFAAEIVQRRVAWCWFASELESAFMWSVYGHQGIAVRTTSSLLKNSLPAAINFKIKEITYLDRRKFSDQNIKVVLNANPELCLTPHFLKAVEYEHEREVRVAAFCREGAKGRMISNINTEVLIQEIVISPLLPLAEVEAIEKIVTNRLKTSSVTVRRSNLCGDTFGEDFRASCDETDYGTTDNQLEFG
jgi:hypothetical protein